MNKLIEIFSRILAIIQGDRVAVQFYTEQVYKSKKWTKPSGDMNISDVTFYNVSTSGIIYVNRIPIIPGGFKVFSCQWNELNITDYQITIDEATVTDPQVVIDFKKFEKPKS